MHTIIGLHLRQREHKSRSGELKYTDWQVVRGRVVVARGETRIGAVWAYVCAAVLSIIRPGKTNKEDHNG